MVSFMIVLRLQQQLPLVLELMAAFQFLLFPCPADEGRHQRIRTEKQCSSRMSARKSDDRGQPTEWRHSGSRRKHVEEEHSWRRVSPKVAISGCSWLEARSSAVASPTLLAAQASFLLVVGAAIVLAAAIGFLKIKPLEGENPVLRSPESMKWLGAGVCLLGWLVTLGGLHLVNSNGGRIVVALLGHRREPFGILYVLPAAFNKTAFWRSRQQRPRELASARSEQGHSGLGAHCSASAMGGMK